VSSVPDRLSCKSTSPASKLLVALVCMSCVQVLACVLPSSCWMHAAICFVLACLSWMDMACRL
jgi:hypothetical protein